VYKRQGHGHACLKPEPGSDGGRLAYSRWPGPLQGVRAAWTPLRVLHHDAVAGELMLGSDDRRRWLLWSRSAALGPSRRQALMRLAWDHGYEAGPVESPQATAGAAQQAA
jgi:hypothetical protein